MKFPFYEVHQCISQSFVNKSYMKNPRKLVICFMLVVKGFLVWANFFWLAIIFIIYSHIFPMDLIFLLRLVFVVIWSFNVIIHKPHFNVIILIYFFLLCSHSWIIIHIKHVELQLLQTPRVTYREIDCFLNYIRLN